MKRALSIFFAFALAMTAFPQERSSPRQTTARRGEAAGYSSRDATTLSMMGWGIGLVVGIAAFCALMEESSGSSSSSHSH